MRGLICVLACVAALVAQSQAQPWSPPFGGNPGLPGAGGYPAGQPGLGPVGPAAPGNPTGTCTVCPKFWMEHMGCCYRFDSGAISTAPTIIGPVFTNPTDGVPQAEANMACSRMQPGASLVTVNNMEENNFLYEWAVKMMAQPQPVWIGLHLGPTGKPQWYSGETVLYSNWEAGQTLGMGEGATIFDADIQNSVVNNQVEITPQWVPEEVITERPFICEYHPQPVMQAPTVATTPVSRPTTTGPSTPAPVMMNNNPVNIQNGGIFGGSRLHEVPRNQRNRPVNYRMNPYYGVMP